MPSLKDIRKRIGTVKNTQKITKAMKMVAAARLRKAQQQMLQLRPYAEQTRSVLAQVAVRAGEEGTHPLLEQREPSHVLLVVVTSDRGLAGAFNASVQRTALRAWLALEKQGKQVSFAVIGRKGADYLRRRGAEIQYDFASLLANTSAERGRLEAQELATAFCAHKHDQIVLVYNRFKSAIAQEVQCQQLLPVPKAELEDATFAGDFVYEPNETGLLDVLLPMYVHTELLRALLESVASEHAARMTAMDSATSNASDMISRLTLQFNRARQAAITKELMEIIGGAEALG